MPAIEQDPRLYETGAGTPLGRLLRCFWLPLAIAADLTAEQPIRPVRILSEDLVLFRDTSGRAGLIQARCPHGGYPLELGSVEETGIVCARHGWHFDGEGNCFVVNFTGTVYPMAWAHARTYPVQEHKGLLWAYLGPPPAPPLPDLPLPDTALHIEAQDVVELPWLDALAALPACSDAAPLWLLRPVDDTHTWRVAITPDAALLSDLGLCGAESLHDGLLRAVERIEAGEEPADVARQQPYPMMTVSGL